MRQALWRVGTDGLKGEGGAGADGFYFAAALDKIDAILDIAAADDTIFLEQSGGRRRRPDSLRQQNLQDLL
jgi:Ca2+-binding RTX toxin-like protein